MLFLCVSFCLYQDEVIGNTQSTPPPAPAPAVVAHALGALGNIGTDLFPKSGVIFGSGVVTGPSNQDEAILGRSKAA